MSEYLEFSATIRKLDETYEIKCPEIGLSLTSRDQDQGLEIMKKWTRSIVDDLVCKDIVNC